MTIVSQLYVTLQSKISPDITCLLVTWLSLFRLFVESC